MAGGVTVGFGRSRALVGEQTVSWSGEACALHSYHSSEPFAASRVCDERSGTNRRTALDPAPASQALPVSLDFADAFIDTLSLPAAGGPRRVRHLFSYPWLNPAQKSSRVQCPHRIELSLHRAHQRQCVPRVTPGVKRARARAPVSENQRSPPPFQICTQFSQRTINS